MERRAALLLVLLLAGCARKAPLLHDLIRNKDLYYFALQSVRGVRDGDHLTTHLLISDSSSILTVDLRFAIGSPTTLESGKWQWDLAGGIIQGTVSARSVTFLGGQDGPPSIGGTFDLSGPGSSYRLTLPLTALPRPFRPATSNPEH